LIPWLGAIENRLNENALFALGYRVAIGFYPNPQGLRCLVWMHCLVMKIEIKYDPRC